MLGCTFVIITVNYYVYRDMWPTLAIDSVIWNQPRFLEKLPGHSDKLLKR